MCGAGPFVFKNSEILGKHSLGIDTSFATMSDPPTKNLGFFVQANGGCHFRVNT